MRAEDRSQRNGRAVVVAGATGLVGRAILAELLADDSVAAVHSLGRREPQITHPKLKAYVVNFTAVPPLPPVDEVYLALGTTIKAAGSQPAFRAVDFAANLSVAHAALAAGAKRCGLVSAMGANANSRVFYNRVKGELEDALAALTFEGLVIARPSLLLGDRQALGQPERPLERLAMSVSGVIAALTPKNYRPINASDVARALLKHVPAARGRTVLLSGAMQP